jgi:hypothetical protein
MFLRGIYAYSTGRLQASSRALKKLLRLSEVIWIVTLTLGNMPGTPTKINELQYSTFSNATNKHSPRKVIKMTPEGSLPFALSQDLSDTFKQGLRAFESPRMWL